MQYSLGIYCILVDILLLLSRPLCLTNACRQQDLLKNIVEIKPKRPRVDSPSNREQSDRSNASNGGNSGKTPLLGNKSSESVGVHVYVSSEQEKSIPLKSSRDVVANKAEAAGGSLLGLSYESSDED